MNSFSETIRDLRVAQDFACLPYLSRIELGKEKPPRPEVIKNLAAVLATDSDILFRLSSNIDPEVVSYLNRQPHAMRLIHHRMVKQRTI